MKPYTYNTCFETEIDFGVFGEHLYAVAGTFEPAQIGCDTLANGDPGWPAIPSDFICESIRLVEPDKETNSRLHFWWKQNPDFDFLPLIDKDTQSRFVELAREVNE